MPLSAVEIRRYLPHRYPFLLVDRVEEISVDKTSIVATKNVSANEPFFQGHFPEYPIMPGVLVVEALAQAGAILVAQSGSSEGKLGVLAGLDGFRFRKPVLPGDVLRLEVRVTKMRGPVGRLQGRATVDGQLVTEGEITFAVADVPTAGSSG